MIRRRRALLTKFCVAVIFVSIASCASNPKGAPERLPDLRAGGIDIGVPPWCLASDTRELLVSCEGASITASGSKPEARQRAWEQAYTALARKLEAKVTSVLTVRQSMSSLDAQSVVSRSVIENAVIEVEALPIIGVRETKSGVGDVGGSVYVRLELDRADAQAEILRQITIVDDEIRSFGAFTKVQNRLQKARDLYPVLALATRRESLERQLALVGITENRRPKAPDVEDVVRVALATIDSLVVVLRPSDQTSGGEQRILAAALRENAGINVQNGSVDADIIIDYAIRSQTSYERTARVFSAAGDIDGVIKDSRGRALSGFQYQEKGFGASEIDAQRRLINELSGRVADDIVQSILGSSRAAS